MKIFLFLLIPVFLFGQYGNNVFPGNGDFEDYTGTPDNGVNDAWGTWAETYTTGLMEATTDKNRGTVALRQFNNSGGAITGMAMTYNGWTASAATIYRMSVYIKNDGGTGQGTFRLYDNANAGNVVQQATGVTGTSYQKITYTWTTAANFTTGRSYLYGPAANGDSVYWDDYDIREKLDTLRVSTTGSDTDRDTVQTGTEAFVYRGSHSGGVFEFLGGTFAESVTIDSSFSKLYASTATIINQIDFNNVTATVDLANLTIATKLNDSNITYLNEPSTDDGQDKGFKEHRKFPGFKDWR